MHVLIIKNVSNEGPGTIADHLSGAHISCSIVEPAINEPLPDPDSFTHLVIMGGPMGVYEMHRHAFLASEALLISEAIKRNKHVLGVCLGAQMVAHCLGARVYPGRQKEIGWYEVSMTSDGMNDPLLAVLAVPGKSAARVFQWHGDTFDLPRDAVRLASSELYPNQAFRYADRVYALQFHIEVTPTVVREWLRHVPGVDFEGIAAESERIFSAYRERAMRFYQGFFSR